MKRDSILKDIRRLIRNFKVQLTELPNTSKEWHLIKGKVDLLQHMVAKYVGKEEGGV